MASVEGRRDMSQYRRAADLVMATQTWLGVIRGGRRESGRGICGGKEGNESTQDSC